LSRVPGTNGKRPLVYGPQGRRILAVPAGDVRPGDVLYSSELCRDLPVVAVRMESVRADGNIMADPDDPDVERTLAVVLTVLDNADAKLYDLGAFAPRARVQVVRHVARA
jgi:hypothetical protein